MNGALHVIRALPPNLDPGEAAMLYRAMPETLVDAAAAARGVNGQKGTAAARGRNQNVVHGLVLFCLCWLYSSAEWVIPKVAVYGSRLVKAEREHGHLRRLARSIVEVLLWFGACWPCQTFQLMFEYAAQGVCGALFEFGERAVAREVTTTWEERAVTAGGQS